MKKIYALALSFALLLTISSTVHAQAEWLDVPPGYTPADGIKYFVEGFKETVELLFTFGNDQKAYKYLERAEERVAEVEAMATRGQHKHLNKTALRYQKELERAELAIAKVKEEGAETQEFEEKMAGSIIRHQAVLQNVYGRVPEEAQEAIQTVLQTTQNRYQELSEKMHEGTRAQIAEQARQRIPDLYERLPQKMRLKVSGLMKVEDIEEIEMEE